MSERERCSEGRIDRDERIKNNLPYLSNYGGLWTPNCYLQVHRYLPKVGRYLTLGTGKDTVSLPYERAFI